MKSLIPKLCEENRVVEIGEDINENPPILQ